jgi:hypothetical protein
MNSMSYSQAGQDKFVIDTLKGKTNGLYVEIGAYHSKEISNTYMLEKDYDWSGVSFEIMPDRVEEFNLNRSNRCLLADATKFNYEALFDILQYPKQIDYLQIDIEPAKQSLEALYSLPLDKYRFSVITFEHDLYADPSNIDIKNKQKDLLLGLGYQLAVENVKHEPWGNIFEDWWIDSNMGGKQK